MELRHLIFTRFSIRASDVFGAGSDFTQKNDTLLSSKKLSNRLRLFEMLCAPSVGSQTCQDFTWIILVDHELGEKYRSKISDVIPKHVSFELYETNGTQALGTTEWISKYLDGGDFNGYLMTTNLDDDDALPKNYCQWLHEEAQEVICRNETPIAILGCYQIIQWDFRFEKQAPLGYKSPWHRGITQSSCGHTVLAKIPEFPFTNYSFLHRYFQDCFDVEKIPDRRVHKLAREKLIDCCEKAGISLGGIPRIELFRKAPETISVLISNHVTNDQVDRFVEFKSNQIKVTIDSFSEFNIDWSKVKENKKYYKLNPFVWKIKKILHPYTRRFKLLDEYKNKYSPWMKKR